MKGIVTAVSLITRSCVAWPAAGADEPMVVELWTDKAPEETGEIETKKQRRCGVRRCFQRPGQARGDVWLVRNAEEMAAFRLPRAGN
jgi:hypothetical protein